MKSKFKKIFLLWSIVSVIVGCQQKGTITRKLKNRTVAETLGNKADPSAIDPSSVQNIMVNTQEAFSSEITFAIDAVSAPSASCSSAFLSYSSSNASLVAAQNAVIWGGVWPNCTAIFSLVQNAIGSSLIEIAALKGANSIIVKSVTLVSEAFNVAPTMSSISSPQTTSEDTALSVAFTASDVDGALTCTAAHLQYSSDTASLVATSGAVSWSGTWPNCTGTISSVSNASGTANITFTISDGALTASRVFVFTVAAVNDAPTIFDVTNQSMNEDSALTGLAVTISDVDTSLVCATALSAASSNVALLPNTNITIGGSAPNCTVSMTPAANQNGTSTVTLTVSDGSLTAQDTFVLTVSAVNDTPTISDVAPQTTPMDTALNNVAVTINDIDSTLTCASSLSATSSNTTLLPNANITIGGTAPNCTVSTNPAAGQGGTSTVTLIVSDGALTAQDAFTLRVFRKWYQEAYVKAVNAEANDMFGIGMSLSNDTLAVGAYYEDSNQTTITSGTTASTDNSISNSGAAYVYKRTGTTWAQEAYIKAANPGVMDNFGMGLSLSGSTLAVGAWGEDSNQTTITNGTTATTDNSAMNSGAVYVYKGTGTNWAQEAYIKAANAEAGDYFGSGLSLSGNTLAVSAYGEASNQTTITTGTLASADNSASGSGAVYIYRRTGTTWAQEAYMKAANGETNDTFSSVRIWGDTLAVGANGEDSNQTAITNGTAASANNSSSSSGAVYVYRRTGGIWGQEAYIKAANAEASDYFAGASLSGDTLSVGASGEDSNQTTITNGTAVSTDNSNNASGAVYVYKRTGAAWAQEAYIKAVNAGANDGFGGSALLGDTLVAGSSWEASNQTTITNGSTASTDDSASRAGAAYVYKRTGTNWAQEAYIKAGNAKTIDFFGGSALSGDTLAVEAYQEDSNQTTITNGTTVSADASMSSSGAVYVYRNDFRLFEPDIRVSEVTQTSITFVWGANLGTSTTLKVAPVAASTGAAAAGCAGGTVLNAGDTSYTYSGLTAGTKYGFRFCTWDGTNASGGTTIWEETSP